MSVRKLCAAWSRAVLAILSAIAAVGLTISSAGATLIEKDLFVAGDKLITLDTSTRLEWLDVTATLGLSYDAAELTPFVTIQNFRHANQTEIAALYTEVGVLIRNSTFVAANYPGAKELIDKLGCVGNCSDFPKQYGWTDLVPFNATIAGNPFVQYAICCSSAQSDNTGPTDSPCFGGCNKAVGYPEIGNYLVRRVPEPTNLALFGAGLAGLGALRRRRRTKAYGNSHFLPLALVRSSRGLSPQGKAALSR